MRHSGVAIKTIQKNSDTLFFGSPYRSQRQKKIGGVEGFILMPQNVIQIGQRAKSVSVHIVRLKAILGQDRVNERSLIALSDLVKDGRERE